MDLDTEHLFSPSGQTWRDRAAHVVSASHANRLHAQHSALALDSSDSAKSSRVPRHRHAGGTSLPAAGDLCQHH